MVVGSQLWGSQHWNMSSLLLPAHTGSQQTPSTPPLSPSPRRKISAIQRLHSKKLIVPSKAVCGLDDEWKPEQPKNLSLSSGVIDVNVLFFKLRSTAELTLGWVAEKEREFSLALAKCATHNLMKKLYGNMTRNNVESVSFNGTRYEVSLNCPF